MKRIPLLIREIGLNTHKELPDTTEESEKVKNSILIIRIGVKNAGKSE